MTGFAEVQFPPEISYGAVGGPQFHTTVLTLANGYEQRNIDWSLSRAQYDVSQGVKTQADMDVLLAFFYARMGRAFGFRFKDWTDFNIPSLGYAPQLLGTTDGATAVFQIVKTYADAAGSFSRPILKPVAGTFQLLDNGAISADWTLDTTTGLVTIGAATAATTGHVLTCSLEFDTPVRFDIDDMKVTLDDFGSMTWGQISIIELRSGD
jgi:uncharacterized protein (TIGR02217 family)